MPAGRLLIFWGRNLLLLALGFGVGNASVSRVETLAFKNASLYEAVQRLHRVDKTNYVFLADASQRKTFSLTRGTDRHDTAGVANRYGRDVVSLGGIIVLDPTLGTDRTGAQRIAAADDWLKGVGGVDGLRAFKKGMAQSGKDLAASLGSGQFRFGEMSDAQQADALDLLRKMQIGYQVSDLAKLFSAVESPPIMTLPAKPTRP